MQDFCFVCSSANGCACRSNVEVDVQTDLKIIHQTLKMLSAQNFSPPFNQVSHSLWIGDLRSCFEPPAQCTHVVSLSQLNLIPPSDGKKRTVIHMEDDPSWSLAQVRSLFLFFFGFHCVSRSSRK